MLNQLYASYGKMTPQDLQLLDKDMKKSYDPHLQIENLFQQIENRKDLAEAAGALYAESKLLNIAYNLVSQSNVFKDTCRERRKLPQAQKSWQTFKVMFTEAHQDYRESHTQSENPYMANAAVLESSLDPEDLLPQETTYTLANLAAATTTDRAALAALTSTNKNLTKQLTEVTKSLTKALDKIQRLETTVTNSSSSHRGTSTTDHKLLHVYCSSHRFRVGRKHNSHTCKAPKEGHKKEATTTNMMGGSELGLNDVLNE